ncbi:TspO/MBR family protein [Maledivibacter halophilus]|uniref:TspO and MBR related proteins n=1 Tax=Maledivibacter halophilus TaxID=36842 RepID=A0A1T5MLG0_9FIRM|nr:TspO/MBR family protein [Maledivibacter halophilus]SKC89036.1 TspO and MBR related proteins [Maledivibacter halophilus]
MLRLFRVKGKVNWIALIISILIPLLVGFLSSYLVGSDAYNSFEELTKPGFAPPAWVFAPAWIILYTLMGIASYRVWMYRSNRSDVRSALIVYGVQLFFNFLWTIIFFGLGLRGVAYIEIIILLILIIITTIRFYKIDKISGYLMIPYILWVSFASVLNLSIWLLNK